jgi:hypothetical protein
MTSTITWVELLTLIRASQRYSKGRKRERKASTNEVPVNFYSQTVPSVPLSNSREKVAVRHSESSSPTRKADVERGEARGAIGFPI